MARYWENNGQPLDNGRLCLVIDPEDGTHPLRTYGATKEEVLDKVAKSLEHGQRLITRQREVAPARATAPAPAPAPARRTQLTPDEQMTAVADLANPAKAPEAVTRLVEHATGIDLKAQAATNADIRLGNLAESWGVGHPEIASASRAEKRLLLVTAIQIAGGAAKVTSTTLDAAYNSMLAQGYFAEEPEEEELEAQQTTPPTTPTSATPGNGNPRTTVRPRGATSVRSSTLRATAPAAPRTTAKYTRAQVDAMSGDELADKMRTEPGFAQLLETYSSPQRRASA
jgi:hypothetical protein